MTLSLVVSDSYYSSSQRGKAGPQLKSLLELANHTSFSIANSVTGHSTAGQENDTALWLDSRCPTNTQGSCSSGGEVEWVLGAVSHLSPQVDTNSPLALPHTLFNLITTHEIKRHSCFYHFINTKTEIQRTNDHMLFQQAPRNIFQR